MTRTDQNEALHVVTVATHNEGYFKSFMESCIKHDICPIILGWGQEWQGFSWRLHLMANALLKLKDSDIVIFCDAYDIICLKHKDIILKRFKEFQCEILCGADGSNENLISGVCYNILFGSACMGSNLNGGFYIGYVRSVKRLLEKVIQIKSRIHPKLAKDDQILFSETCQKHSDFFVWCDRKTAFIRTSGIYFCF